MNFFSVFSGIGGFDLGLERAGWRCVGQCEIEPFCMAALEKHWPQVWRWQDVKTLSGELIRRHCGQIDALVGGPPCQPSSIAGQRRGAADDRWLWPDFLRLVSEVEPMWVLAENPRGVFSIDVEGMEFSQWIAGEFAARGYDLLPIKLAAEDIGAPHRRERIWFVGRRMDDAGRERPQAGWDRSEQAAAGKILHGQPERAGADAVADPGSPERRAAAEGRIDDDHRTDAGREEAASGSEFRGETVADAQGVGEREPDDQAGAIARERTRQGISGGGNGIRNGVGLADSDSGRQLQPEGRIGKERGWIEYGGWPSRPGEPQHEWEAPRIIEAQSEMGLTTDGLPVSLARWRVAALKACGNAVVPQCAEVLGRMISRFNE